MQFLWCAFFGALGGGDCVTASPVCGLPRGCVADATPLAMTIKEGGYALAG